MNDQFVAALLEAARQALAIDPKREDLRRFDQIKSLRVQFEDLSAAARETDEYRRLDYAEDVYFKEIENRFRSRVFAHEIDFLELCAAMYRSNASDALALTDFIKPLYGDAAAATFEGEYVNDVEFWRELLAVAFHASKATDFDEQQRAYWQCEYKLAKLGKKRSLKAIAVALDGGRKAEQLGLDEMLIFELLIRHAIDTIRS